MTGVLQVVQSLRTGGLERVVLDLVNHGSRDFRFVVCCLEEAGPWASQLAGRGLKVVALGKRRGLDWRLVWKIARLVRAENIQVVHTHNCTAHLYGSIGGKIAGAKVLHTEHHPKLGAEEVRVNRINRIASFFTDHTVAVSPRLAEIALAHEGARADRLSIVPNGIPVEAYTSPVDRACLRRELGVPPTAKIVGSVGRLVAQKNHALLIEAFKPIAHSHPDSFLVIAGDGNLRPALAQQIETLQLKRRAFLLGNRSDVPQLLGSFDVFALSSDNEGHPVALLEAMAAGCPCVVTNVPGNKDVIEDGVNGLLVPPRDAAALGSALLRLLNEAALAQRLGTAARQTACAKYSVQEMVRRYEALWRGLANASLAPVTQPTVK